jgi:hypothetical protein
VIYKEVSKDKAIVEIELNNVTAFIALDSVVELVEVISGKLFDVMYLCVLIYMNICVSIYEHIMYIYTYEYIHIHIYICD